MRPTKLLLPFFVIISLLLAGCGGGGGGGSSSSSTGGGTGGGTGGTSLPGTPYNVSVTASSGQVTLNWSAASGATSYNVYWSTSPGVTTTSGTKISGVTSTSYVQTGLTNQTTYYYIVTAVNSAGEGSASTQISASPPWSNATMLDTVANGYCIYPDAVDINSTGTGAALWEEGTCGTASNNLMANVYQSGAWTGTSTQLATNTMGGAAVVTPAGDVVATYVQQGGVSSGFYAYTTLDARYYDHTTGTWSVAQTIGGSGVSGTYAFSPAIATDSNGNVMAIWTDQVQIYAIEYSAASGTWASSATQISNATSTVYSTGIHLVADGNGVFTAVWTQADASGAAPYIARFSGGTWSASSSIGYAASGTTTHNAEGVSISANAAGNVSVVWGASSTTSGTTTFSIDGAQFDPVANTWSAAAPLFTASSAYTYAYPKVAIDGTGNAIAVWERNDSMGNVTIWESSYNAGTGTWSTVQEMDDANGDGTQNPVVGMDSAGNAEVIWEDFTKSTAEERHFDAASGTWQSSNSAIFQNGYPLTPIFTMNAQGYGILLGQELMLSFYLPTDAWAYLITP